MTLLYKSPDYIMRKEIENFKIRMRQKYFSIFFPICFGIEYLYYYAFINLTSSSSNRRYLINVTLGIQIEVKSMKFLLHYIILYMSFIDLVFLYLLACLNQYLLACHHLLRYRIHLKMQYCSYWLYQLSYCHQTCQ